MDRIVDRNVVNDNMPVQRRILDRTVETAAVSEALDRVAAFDASSSAAESLARGGIDARVVGRPATAPRDGRLVRKFVVVLVVGTATETGAGRNAITAHTADVRVSSLPRRQ
jgi:hypothetical protein